MISIRHATSNDIEVVSELRIALLSEMEANKSTSPRLSISDDYFLNAIKTKLVSGTINCNFNGVNALGLDTWLLEFDNKIVSTGALITTINASFIRENILEGYIFNMYTQPAYRGKGCGKTMLNEIILFAKSKSIERLWLKASKDGFPLYKNAGFKIIETPESGNIPMEIFL